MPFAAPTICGCGRTIKSGERCSCRVQADRARAKAHDLKRGSARARGYTSKWDSARSDFLRLNPACRYCTSPATVVDHIIPHRGDIKLFWQRTNWQPLCTNCHSSRKQAEERAQDKGQTCRP